MRGPSFSRDGKWVCFTSDPTGQVQIWKIPTSGGDAIPVTVNGGFMPELSPDGAYIYYVQTWNPPSPLWRVPVSGGAPAKLLEGVLQANFVTLDRGIYYIDRPSGQGANLMMDAPSGEARLQYFDLTTRRTTTVARNLGNVFVGPLTATKDGRDDLLYPSGLLRGRFDAG